MFNFIRELMNPGLKCQRLGHDTYAEIQYGYKMLGFRADIHWVKRSQVFCRRCQNELGPMNEHVMNTVADIQKNSLEWQDLITTRYHWKPDRKIVSTSDQKGVEG